MHNSITHRMPRVPISHDQPAQRPVPHAVPGLLRTAGAEYAPEQAAGIRHARGHRALQGQPWPGRDIGVRGPDGEETPLSHEEVLVGVALELFDGWPLVQRWRPAGSWERAHVGQLARPSFWDGLL